MSRKTRTDTELAVASVLLHREVRRFTVLVNAVIDPTPNPTPIASISMLEAFLVHTLFLLQFLHPQRPRVDDILARDFFDDPDRWDALVIAPSERLKLARRRAVREHDRLRYGTPRALPLVDARHVLEIANEISAGINVFLTHVPTGRLGEPWSGVVGGAD